MKTLIDNNASPINVAVVGYGMAGKVFHAPLINGVPGLKLHTIVSSKPTTVLSDWPEVVVRPTLEDALADPNIHLVVIATSNTSHHPLAKAALLAGKHVVVDKPCTVTLAETEDLLALAQHTGRMLTVFQNRRWDADFLTLKEVLASGQLGRIVHLESHFDRFRPEVPNRWRDQDLPGSGLWHDLGAHVVDQAVQLFGVPDDLLVDLACQRDSAVVHDYFHAVLRYVTTYPGLRVVLHAGALVGRPAHRFAVHGTKGSFLKSGLDVQEDALKAGARPQLDNLGNWGQDPRVGVLVLPPAAGQQGSVAADVPAPDVPGNYLQLYAQVRDHLRGAGPAPVTPAQIHQVMALLERGIQSAKQGEFVATADLRNA
ncbi:MAG: hypothetical protein RLZZ591_1923 [Pseudomonadota bacterium]|jgi:predicted dehydrogenase